MPIYEYHCDNCDMDFETLVLGGEPPECPKCKTREVKRLMSGFAVKCEGGFSPSGGGSSCGSCSSSNCSSCGS